MKTQFFILALTAMPLCLLAGDSTPTVSSGSSTKSLAQPHIQFSSTSFNFDKVQPTDQPQHDFIFTNTGPGVLEITDVRPHCGCTTAGAWDRQIQPGKTGKIPLAFNPSSFSGPISKGATVVCNDPAQPSIALQFQANVWRPIELQPQHLYFLQNHLTNETKVVRIVSNLEKDVIIEPPLSSSPSFQTELKTVRPGKEYELRVTSSGDFTNASRQAEITMKTSHLQHPMLNVPITVIAPVTAGTSASQPAINRR